MANYDPLKSSVLLLSIFSYYQQDGQFINLHRDILRITSRNRLTTGTAGITAEGRKILITYLLTPWCRVNLGKLTGLQLVKKFPAFYGTRMFITALTSVRHLSLSWANPIQSTHPHPTSWRSILILSTHLRLGLPSGLFSSGFPTKAL